MKSWHDEGIPLAIVLEAMDGCFRKAAEQRRNRVVSSLSYCRHAVQELWSDRRDLQIGSREDAPESDPQSILDALAGSLRSLAREEHAELAQTLDAAADRVLAAARGAGAPAIEERLVAIENELFAAMWSALSDDVRAGMESEITRRLASSPPSGEAYERAVAANRRALLRSRFGIPTLSLFA